MFSPIVSAPLTCWPGSCAGSKPSYCSISIFGALLELLAVGVGPPVVQVAVAVVLRALVVEAVADLVADDRADAAVVDRVVGVEVEERRLQDRGREDDLVHPRVVVGVDRLGRHEPLVAVDRLAELARLRSSSNAAARRTLPTRSSRRISAPSSRATCRGSRSSGVNLASFSRASLAGLGAHPVEGTDVLAVGLDQVLDQFLHPVLGRGREVPLDVELADGLAQGVLDEPRRRASTAGGSPGAGQGAAVEGEVLVDERLVSRTARAPWSDVPGQPGLPGVSGTSSSGPGHRREVARLADDDLVDLRLAPIGSNQPTSRSRGQLGQASRSFLL